MISKIQFPDGTIITSGDAPNAILSATVTQSVNAGSELMLGSVCCQMLEAELFVSDPFTLDAGTCLTFYRDDVLQGTFYTEKPLYPSGNRLKLTAFDPICLLDQDLTQWFSALTGWPYRLYDLAWMVCAQCGLELSNTEIPNGTLEVSPFTATGITGRQLLSLIAEAAGCFCRATTEGKAEFAWYENAPVTAGATTADIPLSKEGRLSLVRGAPKQAVLFPVTTVEQGVQDITLKCCGYNQAKLYGYSATGISSPGSSRTLRNSYGTTISTITATDSIQFTQSGYNTNLKPQDPGNGYFCIGFTHPFQDGQIVTISFDLTLTANPRLVKQLYMSINGTKMGDSFTVREGRQQVALTWVSQGQASYLQLHLCGCSGMLKNFQVEAGRLTSPYAPYTCTDRTVKLPNTDGGSMDWSTGIFTDAEKKTYQLAEPAVYTTESANVFYSNVGQTTVSYRQAGCFQGGLQQSGYATAPIDGVCIRQTEQDVGISYPAQGENMYILQGNPLLASMDVAAAAQTLYDRLKKISYTPCTLKLPANVPVSAGHILRVNCPDGSSFTTYVMQRVQNAHTQTLTATGSLRRSSTVALANARYEDLPGKLLQIDRSIDGLKIENRQGQQQLAALSLTVDGIGTQVQQQSHTMEQQLQTLTEFQQTADALTLSVRSLRENGTDKVATRTGYRFDDTGLHITGSGSDLQNAITEKGMYVMRDENTVVLKADAQGVVARDVSVGNYLIIGQFARLEDYADGRTACYYTGG